MLRCISCNKDIVLISGFGLCGCGIKPLQTIILEADLLGDEEALKRIAKRKLLNLEKEKLLREYFLLASTLLYEKESLPFPIKDLPLIAGLGSWKTLTGTLLHGKVIPPEPKMLIIPKLFAGYYTGAWILSRKQIRSLSLHPFGFAFNFEKKVRNLNELLIYTNLYEAYKELKAYDSLLGYPNILAHPKPNLRQQLALLNGNIYVVYQQLTDKQKEELTQLQIPAVNLEMIREYRTFEGKLMAIKKLASVFPLKKPSFLIWKRNIIRPTEQGWFDKNGNRLTNFDLRLDAVHIWEGAEILSGRIFKGNEEFVFGVDLNDYGFTQAVERACQLAGFYPYIKKELKKQFFEIVKALHPNLKTIDSPCFGILSDTEINLPTVHITPIRKQRQYYITSCPFTLLPRDFRDRKLNHEEQKFVEALASLLDKIQKGKISQPMAVYYPCRYTAIRKLESMGIMVRRPRSGFGQWIYNQEHIIVTDDKKKLPIPEWADGPAMMATAIALWFNTRS